MNYTEVYTETDLLQMFIYPLYGGGKHIGVYVMPNMRPKRRVTCFAAFTADAEPVIGVWGWNKKEVEVRVADRQANGDAFPGEHVRQIYCSAYNLIMQQKLGDVWTPI